MAYGLPDTKANITHEMINQARAENPFVLSGTDPSLTDDKIIVFLDMVCSSSFVISDKEDYAISGTLTANLDMTASPLRVDGGVKLTGEILFAKGFFIRL